MPNLERIPQTALIVFGFRYAPIFIEFRCFCPDNGRGIIFRLQKDKSWNAIGFVKIVTGIIGLTNLQHEY
jgi:hypothetical protein